MHFRRNDIRKTGGLGRWRRKSPATALLAFLLTFAQLQTAFAAIVNTATAGGTFAGLPVVSAPASETVDVEPAIAALTVTKTATTPNFSIAGDVVGFDIVVANTGQTTVEDVSVADPTADSVSCPGGLPVAAIAPQASITCAATHTITPADVATGTYANTASAEGSTPTGAPVGPFSGNASVDRAVADLVTMKTLASGDATPAVGDTVTYVITVTNNGPEAATNVSLADALPAGLTASAGNGAVTAGVYAAPLWSIGTLASGASATLTIEGVVDTGQGGLAIANTSTTASGDQRDPSAVGDDLTETVNVVLPGVNAVADDLSGSPILPTGGATPSVLANDVIDGAPLAPADVIATIADTGGLTGVAINPDGTLSVPANTPAGTYPVEYRICEVANPANCDTAIATVRVSPVVGAVADDLSGSPIPPTGGATPTVFANDTLNGAPLVPADVIATIADTGGLTGVAINPDGTLSVPANTPAGTYPVEYQICEVANPANCDTAIATVVVLPPAGTIAGTVFEDDNSDGLLTPGEPVRGGMTVQLLQNGVVVATTTTAPDGTYRFDDVPTGTGYTVAAIDPDTGAVITGAGSFDVVAGLNRADVDLPIDPSGVVYDATTRAPVSGATVSMTTAGGTPLPGVCFVSPAQQNQVTGPDGAYRFDLVPGADPLCPTGQTEYRIVVDAPVGYAAAPSSTIAPQGGAIDAIACPVDAMPGGSCEVQAQSDAPSGAQATLYYLAVVLGVGSPHIVNNHVPLDPVSTGTATLTKTADRRIAQRGDRILYTITATNTGAGAVTPVTIVDAAPAGFRFVEGSAEVNGVGATPVVNGQTLTFAGLTLPGSGTLTVTLRLEALTSAGPGRHINTATLTDAAGAPLATPATAIVEIRELPVIDCSEVIGKVFDDRNRNGYQDEGEPGLPSVRLATVKGVLITTDKDGRFHVACADMPDSRTGANFILKLDPRTLPTGYRLTTENPRVVRLTAGKMVKMNFGATVGRVVKLDVNDGAFEGSSTTLKPEWNSGIDELLSVLAKEESKLRVTYRAEAGEKAVAQKRIEAIVKLVRKRWRGVSGRYRLEIETEVVVRQ